MFITLAFSQDKFPNLERLELDKGDAMNETCGGPSAEFCCNLKWLSLFGNGEIPNVEAPIARARVSDFRRLKNIVPFSSTSFHYLKKLEVNRSDVLISLLTPLITRTLVQLQYIRIEKCKRMTEIVANEGSEAEAGDEIAFNNLTDLVLMDLPSLTAFHLGNRTIKFPSLVEVEVKNCPKLISLLTPSTARTLEKISMMDCERMTEIVANEGSEAEAGDEIAFNNLTYLYLCDLPSLTAFHLGNHTIKFPSLVEVKMYNCPKLKIFCSGVLSTPGVSDFHRLKNIVPFLSTSFHNLKKLDVYDCDELISLLTPSTAKTLVQLQFWTIKRCKRMIEIVANEGSEAEVGDEIAFNNLRHLEFRDLPSLTAFYLGNRTIKFPSLNNASVTNCPKFKIFCSGGLSTPKLSS